MIVQSASNGSANGHARTTDHDLPKPLPGSDPTLNVREHMASSELLAATAAVREDGGRRFCLGRAGVRPLSVEEIAQLELGGNTAEDWARVHVADGFDWRRVRNSSFHGDVILGRFTRSVPLTRGLQWPAGIFHSTVANCVIGNESLVRDVRLLANYVVGEAARLLDCGRIVCDGETYFGNGTVLPIAIESGGRDVPVYAELTIDLAAEVARSRSRRSLSQRYGAAVAEYRKQAASERGIVATGATVRNTSEVRNTYVGPFARIEGATVVADSTLLSSEEEPTLVQSGSCVTESLLQWGSRVSSLAIVERAVLVEHSHAERHAKVTASILGPNTGVAAGEATSCLIGPFVSFHHQALLIATLWPEGRGNVSYGANVGSNHTSKAPDQEFWPGEGAFFGLGVNIKFPSDFTRSPYTIVACGVTMLPQKLAFPFSLVNQPSVSYGGISPAYNEIIPAWLLTDNLFTLRRNEAKFQARNQARRTRFEFRVFRPEIVDLMRDACRRLQSLHHPREVYTEREIDGLGKNYLLETHRLRAIEAYRFFIHYYALLTLKDQAETALSEPHFAGARNLLIEPSRHFAWEHARRILVDEFGVTDVLQALKLLPAVLEQVARSVERSKAKDDERGPRIIEDYADVHVAAAKDPFVQESWREARRMQQEVQTLIDRLDANERLGGCRTGRGNRSTNSPSHVRRVS